MPPTLALGPGVFGDRAQEVAQLGGYNADRRFGIGPPALLRTIAVGTSSQPLVSSQQRAKWDLLLEDLE